MRLFKCDKGFHMCWARLKKSFVQYCSVACTVLILAVLAFYVILCLFRLLLACFMSYGSSRDIGANDAELNSKH